jgi:DNA-binding LacI/PurR family transcriptional regulator
MVIKDKPKAAVTLQTIADEVGVSRTTVSNAFSKPDQMTPELRDRILAVADKLGYCGPDPVAKSLRSGKSGAYGLVLTESLSYMMSDPAAVIMMQGIAEAFDEREASLLILPARLDRSTGSGISKVREAAVDGFLAFCLASDDPRVAHMIARGLPIAVIHGTFVPEAAFVGIDDRAGGRLMADHALDLGHRRIAMLTFPTIEDRWAGPVSGERLKAATIPAATDRIHGVRDALAAVGLDPTAATIWESSINTVEAGMLGAGRLLDRADRPTAILAFSDQLAIGVLQAAAVRGLRVPHDLTVIGYDDIPAASGTEPPLTTVRQNLRNAGAAAARMLLDGWAGEPPKLMLPIELIVRASSGPAPRI